MRTNNLMSNAVALFAFASSVSAWGLIQYSTVPGYFLQDLNSTNATTFDYTTVNFGLINQTYTSPGNCSLGSNYTALSQWQKFECEIGRLQKNATSNTQYKLLFLGRHGEGQHNAAETFYGTPAWNCYWAELNGNSTNSWSDAQLTPNGVIQAQTASNFWKSRIQLQSIRTPDSFYVSPLTRCLDTANITFSTVNLPASKKFNPLVKEYLREGISIHTCDRRSNKTYIQHRYPSYRIESNFVENDYLWNGVTSETGPAQNIRSKVALDDIFYDSSSGLYISVTSHSGEIASILQVLGHQAFSLNTGAIIPVLVKAVTLTSTPTTSTATWTTSAHCTTPPLSSISNGACVCPNSATPVTNLLVTETPYVSPSVTFVPTGVPK